MEIIQVLDATSTRNCKSAWLNSRPAEKESIRIEEVTKLDLPVNEFAHISMFVESTVLEREFFTAFRNHVIWAQTSRVQNVLEFEMPHYMDSDDHEDVRRSMINDAANGVRQDEYRLKLPIMSLCRYNVSISLRDLIKLYWFIVHQVAVPENKHLRDWQASFLSGIGSAMTEMGVIEPPSVYKPAAILRPVDNMTDGVMGDVCSVISTIPFSLRSQLVRHRQLMVRDNLLSLMSDPSIMTADHTMPVKIKVSGFNEDMREVFEKRSCWVAHYNLWAPLLNKIDRYLNIGESGLPCSGGKCPFEKDVDLRYTDADPNAPCPKHAQLAGFKMSSKNIGAVDKQYRIDGRPQWWRDIIESVRA